MSRDSRIASTSSLERDNEDHGRTPTIYPLQVSH